MLLQEALGGTWVLFDLTALAAMTVCLIAYSISVQSLRGFSPQPTYEVYDSLGGAQARLLLPKKNSTSLHNGKAVCKHICMCVSWFCGCGATWQLVTFLKCMAAYCKFLGSLTIPKLVQALSVSEKPHQTTPATFQFLLMTSAFYPIIKSMVFRDAS